MARKRTAVKHIYRATSGHYLYSRSKGSSRRGAARALQRDLAGTARLARGYRYSQQRSRTRKGGMSYRQANARIERTLRRQAFNRRATKYAVGAAVVGAGAYGARRGYQAYRAKRRTRRDYKGRFAGSY